MTIYDRLAREAACGLFECGLGARRRRQALGGPHSTIGYEVPVERMAAFMARHDAAFADPAEGIGEMPLAA